MSSQRPWLVLDTSTPLAVVGVALGGRALSEQRLSEARRHAEGLIDAIDQALLAAAVTLEDIAGVGVGVGPGSFIGVRTGIATAKGLCLGRAGLPLLGLPSLLAIAASAELPEGRGLVVVDAKRGEVYAQRVEASVTGARGLVHALAAPVALTPEQARAQAAALAFVVGVALGGAADIMVASPSAAGLARVLDDVIGAAAGRGIVDELATLAPDYCRAPDAKLPAVDPRSRRPLD